MGTVTLSQSWSQHGLSQAPARPDGCTADQRETGGGRRHLPAPARYRGGPGFPQPWLLLLFLLLSLLLPRPCSSIHFRSSNLLLCGLRILLWIRWTKQEHLLLLPLLLQPAGDSELPGGAHGILGDQGRGQGSR